MLKIRRSEDTEITTFTLSGRIEEHSLQELQRLLEMEAKASQSAIALDLVDVRLVDREAVTFLAACQDRGVVLKNCPTYVREWIGNQKR